MVLLMIFSRSSSSPRPPLRSSPPHSTAPLSVTFDHVWVGLRQKSIELGGLEKTSFGAGKNFYHSLNSVSYSIHSGTLE